jgi:hypothetical protein
VAHPPRPVCGVPLASSSSPSTTDPATARTVGSKDHGSRARASRPRGLEPPPGKSRTSRWYHVRESPRPVSAGLDADEKGHLEPLPVAVDVVEADRAQPPELGFDVEQATSSIRLSSAKHLRAFVSISSEKSRPTPRMSGRSTRSRSSSRPSPVPRSRMRRASRGTCSSRTLSPSARCG